MRLIDECSGSPALPSDKNINEIKSSGFKRQRALRTTFRRPVNELISSVNFSPGESSALDARNRIKRDMHA